MSVLKGHKWMRTSARSPTRPPTRPSLPKLLLGGMAFWAGTAFSFDCARLMNREIFGIAEIIGVLLCVFMIVSFFFLFKESKAYLIMLFLCMGLTVGIYQGDSLKSRVEELGKGDISSGMLLLLEDARQGSYQSQALCEYVDSGGSKQKVIARFSSNSASASSSTSTSASASNSSSASSLRYGACLQVKGRAVDPGYQKSTYCWNKGAACILEVSESNEISSQSLYSALCLVRNNAVDAFENAYSDNPRDEIALMEGLACGYRTRLFESQLYDSIKKCGLAHLVAVSGAHLSTVTALFAALLALLRFRRKTTLFILVGAISSYLILSGCPISAIRSAIMAIIGMFSLFGKRRPSSLNALGVCAIAVVFFDPTNSLSISFLLSFLSTLGIALFVRYFQYGIDVLVPGMPTMLGEPIALTISANLLCMPVSISLFSQLPLLSVISNLIAAFFFPFLCASALLIGLAASLAQSLFALSAQCSLPAFALFDSSIAFIANAPYSCIPCAMPSWFAGFLTVFAAIGLWASWPSVTRLGGLCFLASSFAVALAIVLVFPLSVGTRIVALDVGQGDAILLQSKGKNILVDTGNKDSLLRQALARNKVMRLDAVVISHADDDHCGSLSSLKSYIGVDQVILSAPTFDCPCDSCNNLVSNARSASENVSRMDVGDTFTAGDFSLTMLWPKAFEDEGGNIDSLCLEVLADIEEDGEIDASILLSGDSEIEQLKKISVYFDDQGIDILKVAHHGSKTGTDDSIAQLYHPKISIISAGAQNRYGHPHQEVLDSLSAVGSAIYRTDLYGDVSCKIDTAGITVSTQR